MSIYIFLILFFLAFDFCRFCMFFSSPPQWPMNSDFEGTCLFKCAHKSNYFIRVNKVRYWYSADCETLILYLSPGNPSHDPFEGNVLNEDTRLMMKEFMCADLPTHKYSSLTRSPSLTNCRFSDIISYM